MRSLPTVNNGPITCRGIFQAGVLWLTFCAAGQPVVVQNVVAELIAFEAASDEVLQRIDSWNATTDGLTAPIKFVLSGCRKYVARVTWTMGGAPQKTCITIENASGALQKLAQYLSS